MAWTHGGVNAEACRVQTPGPGYEVSDSSFHGTISLGQLVRLNEVALPQSRHVEVVGYSEGNHGFLMSLNPEIVFCCIWLHHFMICLQPPSREELFHMFSNALWEYLDVTYRLWNDTTDAWACTSHFIYWAWPEYIIINYYRLYNTKRIKCRQLPAINWFLTIPLKLRTSGSTVHDPKRC